MESQIIRQIIESRLRLICMQFGTSYLTFVRLCFLILNGEHSLSFWVCYRKMLLLFLAQCMTHSKVTISGNWAINMAFKVLHNLFLIYLPNFVPTLTCALIHLCLHTFILQKTRTMSWAPSLKLYLEFIYLFICLFVCFFKTN